jgi:flavin reductase (DIM6/NTAB) family NADH-FMN oxidoreductase RutF
LPTPTADAARETFARLAGGVAVVTTVFASNRAGMTVTSLTSVSMQPPRGLVSLEKGSSTWQTMARSKTCAVSILGEWQEDVAVAFARPGAKRFSAFATVEGNHGPLFVGALAWLEGDVVSTVDIGDHVLVVFEITDCRAFEPREPLVYFNRRYSGLS